MQNKFLHMVISLDRTPERWENVSDRFHAITEQTPIRISAIDKDDLNDVSEFLGKFHDRPLSKGEIACFLSHKSAWETLLNSSCDWALIMEDDIFFSDKSRDFLLTPQWIPKSADLCQISSYSKENNHYYYSADDSIPLAPPFHLVKILLPTSWGTQAYWINRKASEIALKLSNKISIPVDEFLFNSNHKFFNTIQVYSLCPFVVYQDFSAPSLIAPERSILQKAQKKTRFLEKTREKLLRLTKKTFTRSFYK